MKRRTLVALVAFFILSGCSGVSEAYVKADQLTHDAIAPEYLDYVAADPELDDAQKQRRARTVATWATRLEKVTK